MNDEKKISLDDILSEKAVKDMAKKDEVIDERVKKSNGTVSRRIVENISEIAPIKPQANPQEEFENHYYQLMDNAIERTKQSMYEERIKPWQDKCKELALEAELNGEEDPVELSSMINPTISQENFVPPKEPTVITPVEQPVVKEETINSRIRSDIEPPKITSDDITKEMQGGQDIELDMVDFVDDDLYITDDKKDNDDELDKEEDDVDSEAKRVEEEANQKRLLEQLRGELNDHLSFDKLDVSKLDVKPNAVSINAVMNRIAKDTDVFTKTQSVPLYDTGRMISFTPLSGSDIVKLSTENGDSRLEYLRKTYSVMYAHDASIDKNKISFTTWMKTISAGDLHQLYFGLYKATFSGSNFIAYKCPECDNFFMVQKDISEMYSLNKSATEEQKKRFEDIEKYSEVDDNIKNRAELFQVSDNFAILIHPKTLYNTLELEYLDDRFREKYAAILQPMQYIEKVFYIDKSRNSLVPIDMHPDKDSIVKTIKNKCIIIHKMISSITVEQYSILTGKLATYNYREVEASNLIQYHIPAQTCTETYVKGEKQGKKCEYKFEEEEMTPYAMLFTRHQLYINTTLTI